jgi:uncharacterized protein YbcV (DUF1398 family)
MFTLEEIIAAHSKVKSGADFPAYIRDLKELGVTSYETYVSDGHTVYLGENGQSVASKEKYSPLTISGNSNPEAFKADLKAHQMGKTDYPTFCADCAKSGVERWEVFLEQNTCTYFDKSGKEILQEIIPS